MSEKIRFWIPLGLIITLLCGLTYLAGQQNLRMGANDPQIQMSEDIAAVIANGNQPTPEMQSKRVDLARSLSAFSMVFDKDGSLLVSGGQLDGNAPVLPPGVLSAAKLHGQDRVTWQPKPGVRIAAVITYYQGKNEGYVLVGRSLREVEKREDRLLREVGLAWVVIMCLSLIATILFVPSFHKKK